MDGEGNGSPLQYSCLENPMDGGACWAAVHGVAKSRTRLSNFTFIFHFPALAKEMATRSSVLAWRIPGTVQPDGLPSMGSHRVWQDWSNLQQQQCWREGVRVCSVMSRSFTPWTLACWSPLSMRFSQARILEWIVISSFRGSAQPRDQTCGFWIGRLILYHLTTGETHTDVRPNHNFSQNFSIFLGTYSSL